MTELIQPKEKRLCPFCNIIYAVVSLKDEITYINIQQLHLDKNKTIKSFKCRRCKNIVEIKT